VFAAAYAIGVVFLAPISFQLFQVRLADALLPLSILFGWPAIVGLSLGAFVANFFGGLGPVDIVGGSAANFLATLVAWKVAKNRRPPFVLFGVAAEIIIITLVVGTYLSYLFAVPFEVGLLGVLLGSVVAIGILGSLLLFALSRRKMAEVFKARGMAEGV